MAMTVKLEGSQDFAKALTAMSAEVRAKVEKVVAGTAVELRADVVKSISAPGKGTMYYRIYDPETGRTTIYAGDSEGYVASVKGRLNLSATHRASAAGDPPATDTGRLKGSIYFDKIGKYTATVGSALVYAAWLEYGTLTMSARPFFRPAVERMRDKFLDRLSRAVGEAIT